MFTEMSIELDRNKLLADHMQAMITLISDITGISEGELSALDEESLFAYLAFVLQWHKEQIQAMFTTHDQSKQIDIGTLNKFWDLVHKSIIKYSNKADKTATKVVENLILQLNQRAERSMLRLDVVFNSSAAKFNNPNQTKIDFSKFHKLLVNQIIPFKIRNDNAGISQYTFGQS